MLKAVFFDFNGVIINDEDLHRDLVNELLLAENLLPMTAAEYQQFCLGRSDRICLQELFQHRARFLNEEYLQRLVRQKAQQYHRRLLSLDPLPLYDDVRTFLERLFVQGLPLGLVTGAVRSEVLYVLERGELQGYFQVIVTGDDINTSKPKPDGYLLALQRLNEARGTADPESQPILAHECLVIEDTFVGIQAARSAGMSVVGIAHTYPYHFMQRTAHWAVDHFEQIDLERIAVVLSRRSVAEQA
jgi:beta-phosphoglucomutase